jgi:hypothetical protein
MLTPQREGYRTVADKARKAARAKYKLGSFTLSSSMRFTMRDRRSVKG